MTNSMFELGCDGPSMILVGVDGSDTSLRAAAYAAGLARRQHSQITCLFVRTVPRSFSGNAQAQQAASQTTTEIGIQLRTAAEKYAELVGAQLRFLERDGDPYSELMHAAAELRADAIVVGASTKIHHRIAASVAQRLVRHARCPIIVVP